MSSCEMVCIHLRQKIQCNADLDHGTPVIWYRTHFQNILSSLNEGINNQQKKLWIWLFVIWCTTITPFSVEIVDVCFFLFNEYNCKSFVIRNGEKKFIVREIVFIANHPKRPTAISEKALNKQITKNDLYVLQ